MRRLAPALSPLPSTHGIILVGGREGERAGADRYDAPLGGV